MKKLLSLTTIFLTLSLVSCGHMMGHGCCKSDKQCDMKKEKCESCCKDKMGEQCPIKDAPKTEEKK